MTQRTPSRFTTFALKRAVAALRTVSAEIGRVGAKRTDDRRLGEAFFGGRPNILPNRAAIVSIQ